MSEGRRILSRGVLALLLVSLVLVACGVEATDPPGPVITYEDQVTPSPTVLPSPPPSSTPLPTSTPTPSPTPTHTPSPLPSPTPLPTEAPPPPTTVFLDITGFGQEHLLTCEAATIWMLLNYYDITVSEEEIQSVFPIADNPELGFRGPDLDGDMGFEHYGAHAPAVATVVQHFLEEWGRPYRAVWETFATRGEALLAVRRQLADGGPVIVWMTWHARKGEIPAMLPIEVPYTITLDLPDSIDGNGGDTTVYLTGVHTVTLVFGEHVEVVYGVDGRRVHVIDPYSFRKRDGRLKRVYPNGFHYTWTDGPPGWEYFDYAVLYVVPVEDGAGGASP